DRARLARAGRARPGGAILDPGAQRGEVGGGQLFLGRHLELAFAANRLEKQTLFGVRRVDDLRLAQSTGRVEAQPALLLLRAVSLDAILEQQRADPGLEVARLVGGRLLVRAGSAQARTQKQHTEEGRTLHGGFSERNGAGRCQFTSTLRKLPELPPRGRVSR